MTDFKKRLKELREEKQISRDELAKAVKLSYWAIAKYEAGERTPDPDTLQRLASYFGCSVDYLLGRIDEPRPMSYVQRLIPEAIPLDKANLKPIPIYGEIRAGEPMFANEEILGYEYVLEDEVKNGDYFFLLVKGDSMINARICEGDLVLVRKQNWLKNGNIGVFIVNGEEATIKRYYEQDDLIILKPENTAYSPQVYRPEEVIILGKVVQLRVKF